MTEVSSTKLPGANVFVEFFFWKLETMTETKHWNVSRETIPTQTTYIIDLQ